VSLCKTRQTALTSTCYSWLERGLFITGVLCVVFVFMTWTHAAFFQVHARSEPRDPQASRLGRETAP